MPFNGSGVFNRVYNWVNDKNNSIPITASRVDTEDDGFATGLSDCVTRDGQSPATADLPMGGFKHTGVANGVARTDYASVAQVQDSSARWCGTAGGTTNALTIATSPATLSLLTGRRLGFKAASTSNGAVTIVENGLTAKKLFLSGGTAQAGSGNVLGGADYWVTYDAALDSAAGGYTMDALGLGGNAYTNFGPEATIASASTTDLGSGGINTVLVSGTTTITSFGSSAVTSNPLYWVRFSGILTLTHNATSLILPGAANITTVAGDALVAKYEGSGNWRIVAYTPVNESPYRQGTWTPNPTSLTVVGTPTYVGTYTKVGRIVYCTLLISSTTTTAATAGTTYFDGLPFNQSSVSTCTASSSAVVSHGVGVLTSNRVYVPTWSAEAGTYVTFFYEI